MAGDAQGPFGQHMAMCFPEVGTTHMRKVSQTVPGNIYMPGNISMPGNGVKGRDCKGKKGNQQSQTGGSLGRPSSQSHTCLDMSKDIKISLSMGGKRFGAKVARVCLEWSERCRLQGKEKRPAGSQPGGSFCRPGSQSRSWPGA